MAERNRFTNTETKILQVLSDGAMHTLEEIHRCLPDDLGNVRNAHTHIFNLRVKLEQMKQTIRCIRRDSDTKYQQVRLIPLNDYASIS